MSYATRFSDTEWSALQFAVFDTYWLCASIDGRVDAFESEALAEVLSHPQWTESALLRDVLASMAGRLPAFVAAYHPGDRGPARQEASFRKVAAMLAERVEPAVAASFKNALVDLGMTVASASGLPVPGRGRLSDIEVTVLAAISEWLDVDEG